LTGLHRPIAIRGGQSGDVVVVKFDLRRASAELRLGEEREFADVSNADAVPFNSFGVAGVQKDSTGIDLTDDDKEWDLTGSDKAWHPISTAPLEQDLEVRLEDPFGRYVLLFPCRLIPGQGWITVGLKHHCRPIQLTGEIGMSRRSTLIDRKNCMSRVMTLDRRVDEYSLGREPINVQGVRLASVRYCPDSDQISQRKRNVVMGQTATSA
jgi:hypothetical protein